MIKPVKVNGSIRVGTTKSVKGPHPSWEGYTRILCMTKSTPYGDISPYVLKNGKGQLIENVWQFSKYYSAVPCSVQRYSHMGSAHNRRIVWEHPAESHSSAEVDGHPEPNDAYLAWRTKGMEAIDPIRYPVGRKHRASCICAFKDLKGEGTGPDLQRPLDYISSRKELYLPLYTAAVRKTAKFVKLKKRLGEGENLLIIEVDGPHQESLPYYKREYGVDDSFIEHDSVLVTPEHMHLLLNDTKHNFGHGYCLAMALLDIGEGKGDGEGEHESGGEGKGDGEGEHESGGEGKGDGEGKYEGGMKQYNEMTLKALSGEATKKKIPGRSKMKKAALIRALNAEESNLHT